MRRAAAAALALCALLTSCSRVPPLQETTFFAMDTVMELQIYGDAEALDSAQELISDIDDRLSAASPYSEISALNASGSAVLSPDTLDLIGRALDICALTGGALDITVYPLVKAWGFTSYDYRVPGGDELAKLLEKVDYTAVTLDKTSGSVSLPEGAMLDLGAVAKGWTGDRTAELLRSLGVEHAILSLGGNIYALGTRPDGTPWRVGIRDPFSDEPLGSVDVTDESVITSGGYERYFEENGVRYHHILDPATGLPAESGLASVTVIGPDGTLCDGLSTALFVLGLKRASDLWKSIDAAGSDGFEAVFVTDTGEIYVTEGLEGSFTPMNDYENAEIQVIRRD